MKSIILFSPNGYVGGFIRDRITMEKDLKLHLMSRDSDWTQFRENYDVMIYSAAITSARQETAEKYVQDNVMTAVRIVGFCKEHNIKRIIYLSSDEIYGDLNTDTVTERAIMVNPNLYASTKYLAERIIIESKIPFFILRLPGVVGRRWGKNFIYRLMDRIRNNELLILYNIDRKFNNILDVDDLTEFIMRLCKNKDIDRSEIFLLGNTEKIELVKIVSYIKKLHHSTSEIQNTDTDNKRYFTLNVTKAVTYGYCSKSIMTILDELYEIQKR